MRFEQRADFCSQGSDGDASEAVRSEFEAQHGSAQQGEPTPSVSSLEVVKGGRDLDQCLEKAFLRVAQFEPDALPVLMSEEIFAFAVASQTFCKGSALPIESHAFLYSKCSLQREGGGGDSGFSRN
jgi:hypothetical protein